MIDLDQVRRQLDQLDADTWTSPGEYVPTLARLLVEVVELLRPVDLGEHLAPYVEPGAEAEL